MNAAADDRSSESSTVLVVEDDAAIRRSLQLNLRARGYRVELAEDGNQALQLAGRCHPDVVILDLGLPDIDGVDVIAGLRGWTAVPIVVLSARDDEAGKVEALDAGADDYVTKPFGIEELMARLRVALRRREPGTEPLDTPVVETPHFRIELNERRVTRPDGNPIHLTPIEWRLLEVLARSAGRLITQQQLLTHVWGPGYENETSYLRVHLTHLRRKIEPEPSSPRYVITEPGVGYRLEPAGGSTAR